MLQVWLKFILVQNYFSLLQWYSQMKPTAAPVWPNGSQTSQIFSSEFSDMLWTTYCSCVQHFCFMCLPRFWRLLLLLLPFLLLLGELMAISSAIIYVISEHMQRKLSLSGNSRCPDLHVCCRFRSTSPTIFKCTHLHSSFVIIFVLDSL